MNKNRIRLTESDLHRIVKESVKRVMIEEGFWGNVGNKFQGAVNGFSQGANTMMQNDEDASSLTMWVGKAQRVLQDNNPQEAMQFIQNFINAIFQRQSLATVTIWLYEL